MFCVMCLSFSIASLQRGHIEARSSKPGAMSTLDVSPQLYACYEAGVWSRHGPRPCMHIAVGYSLEHTRQNAHPII